VALILKNQNDIDPEGNAGAHQGGIHRRPRLGNEGHRNPGRQAHMLKSQVSEATLESLPDNILIAVKLYFHREDPFADIDDQERGLGYLVQNH
jgi:hypothetical protein